MKKQKRIIIATVVSGILLLNIFYILPRESLSYLKSDINDFKRLIIPLSILLTIIITSLAIFNRAEYNGDISSKVMHILYIGILSVSLYSVISDFVLMVGLKTNRLSSNELINKKFIVTFKDHNNDLDNIVFGRFPNKIYRGEIDKLALTQQQYRLIKKEEVIELQMQNGLLGIPFNPIMKK